MPDDRTTRTFAERLDLLFQAAGSGRRGDVGYQEVVDALTLAGGPTVTPNYMYLLRTGRRTNPRVELVVSLARYFNVPTGYFTNDDDAPDQYIEQLQLVTALKDDGLTDVVLAARGLSPESLALLGVIVAKFRAAEGLPTLTTADTAPAT